MIKHPHVKVRLVGKDGNAFAILGRCKKAAERAGVTKKEIDAFLEEAMSGNYNNLLCVCQKWFNCD